MEENKLPVFDQSEDNATQNPVTLDTVDPIESTEIQYNPAEWCFQFFDNEPVVFAWSEEDEPTDLVLKISATNNSNIIFDDKGMKFKLFARPISEETKNLREQSLKSKA